MISYQESRKHRELYSYTSNKTNKIEQEKNKMEEKIDVVMTSEEIKAKELSKEDLDWIDREVKNIEENSFDGERLPPFKPEENKTEEILVDISSEWQKWLDDTNGTIKKMIPIGHQGEKKLFWLNVKNPLYAKILLLAQTANKDGKKEFLVKILRTGQQQNTRYVIVE